MNNTNDEPAFPRPIDDMGTLTAVTSGLSKREFFAAIASVRGQMDAEATAKWAVAVADALIAELKKDDDQNSR